MKFKKITIENFKSIGPQPLIVDLDFCNTKLLLGSNGAGKSTLMESIVWCIYGLSKLKADNIVNKTVGAGTKVELEFNENNHDYVITRYRKHSVHKNNLYVFEDGKNITLKNPSDNQELVQSIVGIDPRAFMSSIILSSETYKQFLRETNTVRLQIFESVFSLREINDLSRENKLKLKELTKEIADKKSEVQSISAFIESDTAALKAYKSNYEDTVKNLTEQIENTALENMKLESALKEEENIDFDAEMQKAINYQTQLTLYKESKSKYNLLNDSLQSAKQQKELYEEKLVKYNEFASKYSAQILKDELNKLSLRKEQDDQINNIKAKIIDNNQQVVIIDGQIKSLESEKKICEDKIQAAKDVLNQLNEEICPVCGNHIDEKHAASVFKEKNAIIADNISLYAELDNKLSGLIDQKNIYNKETENLKADINSIELIEPKYDAGEIKMLAKSLKEATDNIPLYNSYITKKEQEIVELENQLKNIVIDEPAKNGYSIESLNELKQNFVSIRSKIDANNKIIDAAKKAKETAFDKNYALKITTAIKERKESIAELNEQLQILNKDYTEYLILDEVFSNNDNGFKKYFINKVISMFNDKVNTFLPFFFDDEIEIKFDKDLNDTITFRGKEAEFNELSSGEKTRAELCIVFSLYFMVQSLFGCGTNLLVIDEILDTALDSAGITAARKILDDIAKNTSVFVVSHREELKESFDNVINVYKDSNGFTCIK